MSDQKYKPLLEAARNLALQKDKTGLDVITGYAEIMFNVLKIYDPELKGLSEFEEDLKKFKEDNKK